MYVDERPGRDPTTVWLHHGAGSTRAWETFLPAAAGGRRAIVYDRRGFGRSSHARRLTTAMFDDDVAELRALIGERGDQPVHLIGHSDGGTVALLLAGRTPELVLSVAVVSVHVCADRTTVATLRRMGPPEQWPEPMRRSLRRAHGDDWVDVAGRWYGLHDDLSPPLHAEVIGDVLPGARVTWVDTATHDPHRAEPERFVSDVQSLWRDAEARGG